jgi:ADP-ribose pyrophosphatase YjhB (NUDIX family)
VANVKQTLYLIADEMRGLASLQKYFANDVYDHERAEQLMKLAAIVGTELLEDVEEIFLAEPWLRFSPAVGVDAAVFDEEDLILLVQRADNRRWALLGGLAEIGQTLPDAVLCELWEEAGLRGKVRRVLGIFDEIRWHTHSKVHLVHVVFQVDCEDLTPDPGIEALQARYFSADDLPTDMHLGHELRVPSCFTLRSSDTYFDPANSSGADFSSLQRPNAT